MDNLRWQIDCGDVLDRLAEMPDGSVHCVVTSPPYWGLRDYGVEGQIGLEATPEEFVERMVAVFREVRRVLRDDGVLWLNLGDSYSGDKCAGRNDTEKMYGTESARSGLKQKDLCGIPWRLAFALQADGWYLRSDIIWSKPNPMPESVRDRPTKAHEYVFFLTKRARYFYDGEAIKEEAEHAGKVLDYTGDQKNNRTDPIMQATRPKGRKIVVAPGRNRRTVWEIATQPFPEAHFATFPEKLVEPCILAGCPKGGTVLDPFAGSGTVGVVALRHGRSFVGIELNPEYAEMARKRIAKNAPMWATAIREKVAGDPK